MFVDAVASMTDSHIFAVDSGKELLTHRYPFAYDEPVYVQQRWDAWFAQAKPLKRHGYDIYSIAPKSMGDVLNVDKVFSFDYHMVKRLNKLVPNDLKPILTEIIVGQDASPASQRIIGQALSDETITSWAGFKRKMLGFRVRQGASSDPYEKEEQKATQSTAKSVFSGFNDCIENGYLSDNPNDAIDIVDVVHQHQLTRMIGSLRTSEDDTDPLVRYNGQIKLLSLGLTTEIDRFHQGDKTARLDRCLFWFPEVDSLIPAKGNSSLRNMITQLILKLGKLHCSTIMDVQNVDSIDPKVAKMVNILSGKASGANLDLLKEKGVNDVALEMAQRLAIKQETSVGTRTSQFGFFGRRVGASSDIEPVFFYARPPESQFFDERKYSQA